MDRRPDRSISGSRLTRSLENMEKVKQIGARIVVTGIVQGVGFRPFIYSLAEQLNLKGWVRNTSAGVELQIDTNQPDLTSLIERIKKEAPPLAFIDQINHEICLPGNFNDFRIIESKSIPSSFQPISPDVCICQDCLYELFDPSNRRHLYPFVNCTNCGPRFTIIQDIPYDRPNTTMAAFDLCPDCASEYSDPKDRRFHAQPIACPVCGPQVWLERRISPINDGAPTGEEAIIAIQLALMSGKIAAIKGLGGFHLACDACNPAAVQSLRDRKLRVDKPFALMMADMSIVEAHCQLSLADEALLKSPARPIVILKRRPDSTISPLVSPGQDTIGVMLPYTPLHYLLFHQFDAFVSSDRPAQALVMTSGNLSEEPIVTDNLQAREKLNDLADIFLMHDRPIHVRCDDSVVRSLPEASLSVYPIRRSRGYVPYPIVVSWKFPPILAVGSELKNTFCLARDQYAFLSHHIGDLENFETLEAFESSIAHFERIFRINPEYLAYDLHPDYLATRYALERAERESLPAYGIQHHHAHIAACLTDNQLPIEQPVIGVSFDGTGYGDDGAIWGGEFLVASLAGYQRAAHLKYTPLPGGDRAIRKPARIALAYLFSAGLDWDIELPSVSELGTNERTAIRSQITHGFNAPLTSSVGRLFDAVASLAGICQSVNYEAQAAIELEAALDPAEKGLYPFNLERPSTLLDNQEVQYPYLIDTAPIISGIVSDFYSRISPSIISARFHNTLSHLVLEVCQQIKHDTGIRQVVLSGGVWQNMFLLEQTINLLKSNAFQVAIHNRVPANDGGLALGQAAIAAAKASLKALII